MTQLIQGFFFQERHLFGIASDRGEEKVIIRRGVSHSMFAGLLKPSYAQGSTIIVGAMTDPYGQSDLMEVLLEETHLAFTKKYVDRDDVIRYEFTRKPDGTWRGSFNGKATGRGQAHCILTTIPDEFLVAEVATPKARQSTYRR